MRKLFIIICFLNTILSAAQGEANNWFFGENAGLNFNNGEPTNVLGSKLETKEGCASFSDSNGDLLFYTDGGNVWDRNHNYMPKGEDALKGHPSSTQSAIIVPYPGLSNSHLFYIFTVGVKLNDDDDGEYGLHYYTINMTKNDNLGDVEGTGVNLSGLKSELWTEKITSVKGAACNTFWVISLVKNTFYSYKIDVNGINPIPIISTVNYISTNRRGYLKVSPDGEKLASATFTQGTNSKDENVIGLGKLHLYSFNDETGKVSNEGVELISNAEVDGAPYGVEFSSNSTKVYTSTFNGQTNKLFQFDLTKTNVASTKYLVKSQIGYRGALQLAPNGKIYATVPVSYFIGTNYLDAINFPDESGINCEFKPEVVNLGSGRAMQGLPPFIASLLLPIEITDSNTNEVITNQTIKLCVGSDYTFKTDTLSGDPTYTWKHDNTELLSETSPSISFNDIQFTDAGAYEVKVELTDICGNSKIYIGKFDVKVYEPPSIFDPIIYDQCDIDENTFDNSTIFNLSTKIDDITNNDPDLEVLFYETPSDFDTNNPISDIEEYTAIDGTKLIVKLINKESECYSIGVTILKVYANATGLDTYNDIFTCENSDSNEIQSIGTDLGTFNFDEIKKSIHTNDLLGDPTLEVELYKSSNDAQLQIYPLTGSLELSAATIFVRVSNKETKNCISAGTFNLVLNPIPIPTGNEDIITLCVNNPKDDPQLFKVELNGNTNVVGDTYQWYLNHNLIPGATNSNYFANSEGTYKVEATRNYSNIISDASDDSFCSGFNTFVVIESNPPVIDMNDISIIDDSINNSITIDTSNLGIGDYEFSVNDSFSSFQDEPYFENVDAGIQTVNIRDKNGCGIPTQIKVSVLGFPKFLTPNNDGKNDFWAISGVNTNFYVSSNIYIYDRYGNLIAKINPKSDGWDGTLNGNILPSTDYWFSAELIDSNGNIRVRKGHFSLIN